MKSKLLLIIALVLSFVLYAETIKINQNSLSSTTINILESQEDYTVVEILLNSYSQETIQIENQDYLKITIPHEAFRLEKGNPELPIVARSLMIPYDQMMNIEIIHQSFQEYPGHILPSKGSFSRSINPADVPFEFSSTYQKDQFFPASLVELGEPYIMRELRGIAFRVSPFTYNPDQGTIRVYDRIVFKVYANGTDTVNIMRQETTRITKDFVQMYANRFINYQAQQTRYVPIEEDGSILVICYPQFMESMEPYIEWKKQKGIQTVMIPSTEAGTTAAQIQSYIAAYYQAHPDLAYIQIVGDNAQVPSLLRNAGTLGTNKGSDPAFGMILPNADNHYPDLFVGRFSAENITDLNTQINRTIWYERDIVDAEWLEKGVGIASNEGAGGHLGEFDSVHINNIKNLLLGYNYTYIDHFDHSTPGNHVTNLTNALNDGRGIINYAGHGNTTVWNNPSNFYSSDVNNLANDWKLPFIISVACYVGDFTTTTCFAEAWLRHKNTTTSDPRGAVAVYMSSISQPWQPPMWAQDAINELLVSEQMFTIGGLFFNGACDMLDKQPISDAYHTIRTWNIFGDASMVVRSKNPDPILVNADATIIQNIGYYFVETDAPGATVCLYNPETKEIVTSSKTNANGIAELDFSDQLLEPGDYILTITAYNRITDIREVPVIPGDFAYLVLNSATTPTGNTAEYNAETPLQITLLNLGSVATENVIVTLSTENEFINLNQEEITIPFIEANELYQLDNGFSFYAAENIPDQQLVTFNLNLQYDDQEKNFTFQVSFNAPVIVIGDPVWVDGDGKLAPNQTSTMRINFKNNGSALSPEGNAIIFANNSGLTFAPNTATIEPIDYLYEGNDNNLGFAEFIVHIGDIIPGTLVHFGYFVEFGSSQIQAGFTLPVGIGLEDFADNQFNLNWVEGNEWLTTPSDRNGNVSGYCAITPEIDVDESATMKIIWETTEPGILSFFYKISSLQGVDRLQFKLNNLVYGVWSGNESNNENTWYPVSYMVPAGQNVIEWVYNRTSATPDPVNRAWIDYIVFPMKNNDSQTDYIIHANLDPIDFSNAEINFTYTQEITIANFGQNALQDATISLPNPFVFTDPFVDETPQLPLTIFPNGNKHLNITFRPTEEIDYSGLISIFSSNNEVIKTISINADLTVVSDIDITSRVTKLLGNYPNPFNPETTIKFQLHQTQQVELAIYNVKGQLVKILVNENLPQGLHNITWKGNDEQNRTVATGIYFYKLATPETVQVHKMILLK